MGYKTTAIRGVSWMSLLQLLTRFISIAKFAIIARILTPSDLGLFGIVVLVVGISEIFSEFGVQPFLIQYKKNINNYADSVWVVQLIRGSILFLLILLIAFPVSVFFRSYSLVLLVTIGALNPFIKGFENVYVVNFQKELYFKKEFIYRFLSVVADFFVSVILILKTHSVIGLVLGMLSASIIGVLYSWLILNEKPGLKFNFIKIKKIFHYGKWINLNSILYYVTNQLDSIIIGRLLGTSSLGFYQVSQKFSFTPMQELADIFGKVSFPVYAKISEDLLRLKKAYIQLIIFLCIIEFFIVLFLFIFTKEIILLFLGSKWIITEGLFRIFLIYGFIASMIGTSGSLFLSVGRQDILTKVSFARILILIPLLLFLVGNMGSIGAVYALIFSLLLLSPIYALLNYLLLNGKIQSGFQA
jgi:lipopolysaccharide exporter